MHHPCAVHPCVINSLKRLGNIKLTILKLWHAAPTTFVIYMLSFRPSYYVSSDSEFKQSCLRHFPNLRSDHQLALARYSTGLVCLNNPCPAFQVLGKPQPNCGCRPN